MFLVAAKEPRREVCLGPSDNIGVACDLVDFDRDCDGGR